MFFFDLDGTILDVSERYYQIYTHILKKYRYKYLSKKEYWTLKRNKTSEAEILRLTKAEDIKDLYVQLFQNLIESDNFLILDKIWPDLKETYFELFKKNTSFIVTLRKNRKTLINQLKRLNLLKMFSNVYSDEQKKINKNKTNPKIQILEKVLVKNNVDKSNCFFIGDTETDIKTGKFFSMSTIALSFGIRSPDILKTFNPHIIFDTQKQFKNYLENNFFS
ncbi:MAG: Pyrophosphatase PpaX [Candidatus Anoxychlamydiales bacterium]|nr:Pyrophosphatase PpaX [Candidatus Anoxychlamydiales bacterium]NGX35512.1 Pyrophosphatase PpaX [Candidatus Anoxychlamydiales bacterium]